MHDVHEDLEARMALPRSRFSQKPPRAPSLLPAASNAPVATRDDANSLDLPPPRDESDIGSAHGAEVSVAGEAPAVASHSKAQHAAAERHAPETPAGRTDVSTPQSGGANSNFTFPEVTGSGGEATSWAGSAGTGAIASLTQASCIVQATAAVGSLCFTPEVDSCSIWLYPALCASVPLGSYSGP